MKTKTAAILLASILALSGCQNPDGTFGTKQFLGGVGGAAAGGLGGAQLGKGNGKLAFTALGTLLGAIVGSEVGQSLDHADIAYAQQALPQFSTARTNQQIRWENPQTGNSGVFVPTQNYRTEDGTLCREFWQRVNIGGRSERATGTACLQRDGAWKIVS
jgi:surface antigen